MTMRVQERYDAVLELLEEGLRAFEICERLKVNRQYVWRVKKESDFVYIPREVPEELRAARTALDRAYADFERNAGVKTYGRLIEARERYEKVRRTS